VRRALLFVGIVAAFAVPSAGAEVTLISITKVVHPGGAMSLTVRSGVDHAACVPRVHYRSRKALAAAGLESKGGLFVGLIQWRWRMPKTATRGTWSVDVVCGAAGSLRTTFVVR
jgi:hypothetical protein